MMQGDAFARALFTDMRAGTTKWLRMIAVGPQIGSSGQYYTLQFDVPVKITDVSPFSDEDGVYACEFTSQMFHDGTWGKALEVTVINDQATVA
jgi:hypothetical protein